MRQDKKTTRNTTPTGPKKPSRSSTYSTSAGSTRPSRVTSSSESKRLLRTTDEATETTHSKYKGKSKFKESSKNNPPPSKNAKNLILSDTDIDSQILFEDNHILIVNKAVGQLTQADETNDLCLADYIKDYIKRKYKKPGDVFLGTVHRLDRPVSGIVLFARTSKALERLNKQFADREVKKTYLAIVHGFPEKQQDTLVHYMIKDSKTNISKAYDNEKKDTKRAELTYTLEKHIGKKSLLEVKPLTGRPHQIRVQLAKIGYPIVGDLRYGSEHPNPDKSICLHSHKLEFIHPVKKEPIKFVAPPPKNSIWIPFW